MNILKKKQSMLIAILISLILMVGALLGTFFALKPGRVEAQEYNYGNFNPTGYYELDGVVFYAVKVKEVNGTQTYASISDSKFTLNGIEYTIDEEITKLSYTIGTQTLTINISENQFFTINGLNYAFDKKISPTKVLRVVQSATISGSKFTLGGVEYTIDDLTTPIKLTYLEGETEKTINILTSTTTPDSDFTISFQINGVDYIFDKENTPTKVYRVLYNYWPTYEMTTTNGEPGFIKFGETVLLKPDESIMLCFARQTESLVGDKDYIIKTIDGQKLSTSTSVDLLTGYLEINGINKTNANINPTVGGIQKQEFGYILNLNNKAITGRDKNALLGITDGIEGGVNNEGLIEFTANYEIGSSQHKEYSFMFYAFKEETYQREESINTTLTERFYRPNPAIRTSDSTLLEHVTDSATVNQFFSEAFYYYENQNLPYLEYDYTRYEVNILKTIHNNTITYNLTYGVIDVETGELGVIQQKTQNLSTPDVYAQDLRVEKIEGTTKVRIYFEDLGVYDFLYKAVYYGSNGQKVELETLNIDNRKDRMTIYGTQATYQDIVKGRSSFRTDDNLISADVTGLNGYNYAEDTYYLIVTNINYKLSFDLNSISYTIDNRNAPTTLTYLDEEETKTIEITDGQYFTIDDINYAFDIATSPTKIYKMINIISNMFEIKNITYTIVFDENDITIPALLTYLDGEETKTIEITDGQYFTIDDINYAFDTATSPTKIYFESLNLIKISPFTFIFQDITYTIDSLVSPTKLNYGDNKKITITNSEFKIGDSNYRINETNIEQIFTMRVQSNFEIASTNQPQISLLFNSTVSDDSFKVYYADSYSIGEGGNKYFDFQLDTTSNYRYTSNFTTPGYYYVVVTNQYSQYKIWLGNSTQYSSSTPKTQVYFFQIKDQTPDLGIYQLKDNGEVPNIETATRIYSGSYYNENYIGSYTKNGVQIYEAKATSVFDSPVVLSVQFREFNQTQLTTINLPTSNVSDLTPQQISYLASYGVTKYDGYYTFTKNGHYSVRLNFGKSGSTSCLFDIDTEGISGIKVYNTDYLEGSLYYNSTLLAEQGTFATTKDAIALLWNQKASGAKITAKYVRFDMVNNNYKTTKNYEQDDDNIYKINDTWLAADYAIVLSETNPETIYNGASSPASITSSSVLTLDGLYIFKLQDEAGNIAFYSVLIDTSIPTVLQKPENGVMYKKITGINNVSENTEVFFGSHKAVAFMFGGKLANPTLEGAGSLSEALSNINNAKFAEYYNALFENLSTMGASNILKQDTESNYFATVPIRKVTFKVVDGKVEDLPQSNINQGYHVLVPLRNDPKAGQETGRIADKTYIYQIYDASNKSNKNPTRAYSVRVNTDQTGVTVYYKKENEKIAISHNSSSTAEDLLSITNYYKPVGKNVKLYLTWSNLHFEETMGAYVDLLNSGLVCYFYELTWDAAKNSFKYLETGTLIPLDFSNINDAKERNGESVEISINLSLGRTVAGKYEIIRKYSYTESGLASNLGDDYETVVTTFFVDRTDIISSPSTNGTQNGYYTFMTLFDGGSQANKIFYNSLYQQSQNSNSYVVQTNELPIGFYIPLSKYGTFYKVESGVVTTNITKTDIQSGNFAYQYENLVEFGNLDVSQSAGVTNTVYSPYTLRVILESPSAVRNPKTGLYYHYTYNADGYFMLSGYSVGEGDIITITDRKAFIAKNPITNATEWETGTYKLTIGAIEQDDNSYLQNFKFLFNVTAKTPAYDLDAEYPELENMDSRKLVVGDSNYYYTNANQILVKWEESINNFLTKIDITKVQYTYTAGNATITKYAGADFNIISSGNSRSFKINLPNNVLDGSRVTITMIYETYSTDTENYYKKYYPGGLYQSSRTITIDREAPVDSINNLVNTDETVKGVNPQLLRASSDSRFNKSITTGIYKYYSFMPSATFISDLASSLKINSSTQTNYFYYRYFSDKYATSIIYETGLGLDPTAQANNVFSEYYALNNKWKKVDKNTIVDEAYINNNFPSEGYYELIEFDLAGNMTIYTIYLTSGKDLNIDFNQKLSVAETNGSLKIEKVEEGFKVTLTQLETSSDSINSGIISINSFDTFNFKNLDFGTYSYIYNTVTYNNSYKYMRIKIDDVDYIVTPFGYENVTKGNDTKLSCTKINRRDASGTLVPLNEIKLTASTTAHTVQLYDTVNKKTHTLSIKVTNSNTRITDNGGVNIVSDSQNLSALIGGTSFNKTIALIIREQTNAALKFAPDSLRIYEINESFTNGYKLHIPISETPPFSAGYTTTYYYLPYESSFDTSTFYFAFKDDFGNEYFDYVEYSSINFDRYEYTGNDLTSDMQTNDEILVSRDIIVNFSNLFTTNITARINDNVNFVDATSYYTKMATPEGAYKQFNLKALDILANGYYGGLIEFKIDLVSNIPPGIIDQLTNPDNKFTSISNTNNIIKTIRVKIYNQLPQLSITTNDGSDITNNLLNEEITQSEPITISFNSESNLSDSLGINAKVFIRLRGSAAGYYEITSPTTISEAEIYDIYIQNFDSKGALDFVQSYDFVISDLDVIFYTVVKTNSEGNQEIISPTGRVFKYLSQGITRYVPYHYIVNTDSYEVKTNGEKVKASTPYFDSASNTYIYTISSTASSGVVFNTTIAVTIISATNNILGSNSFTWYYGTTYTSPSPESYIKSNIKEIFLTQEDGYDEVTLRWNSYYSSPYNKITCYVSSDDGQSWSVVTGISDGDLTTLTLKKSSNYLFKFVDYAGNTQTFTSVSGYPSTTTRVTFIRSVIYKLNENNPLDNSIYNGTVTISLPANMASYYSSIPTLVVMKNNAEYEPLKNDIGNYEFTEAGTYVIYFAVKVKNGTKNLNEDELTFTIINENDSRWAFNYVNYNNYTVNYIRYNGVSISPALRTYAFNGNEVNISAFLEDSLGNKYFNNGIYTIKITSIDDAMGSQSFEFNFWLNDATPPVTVSLAEGTTTTNSIKVSFNEANLYETIGDCYVMINNTIISEIDSSSAELQEISLTNVRSYYIQVYTNSGKLAYSYRVEITEPLNTITIILIAVSSTVVVVGLLLFFLLRKRMKIR